MLEEVDGATGIIELKDPVEFMFEMNKKS